MTVIECRAPDGSRVYVNTAYVSKMVRKQHGSDWAWHVEVDGEEYVDYVAGRFLPSGFVEAQHIHGAMQEIRGRQAK